MKFGLNTTARKNIQDIFAKYPQIDSAILYGSRAKGNFKPGSDIDLTLKGHKLNIHIVSKINTELDDLLTPYKFDISIFDEIENEDLLDHIKRVGIVFYKAKIS